MQLETREQGDILIVTPLHKHIDVHMAGAFRRALVDRIDAGATRLVVNLRYVELMDSAGLAAFLSALRHIGPRGALKICSPRDSVRALFQMSRLDRVIPITDGEEETIESFAAA